MEPDYHYEEPPLQRAARIVTYCGTVLNTMFAVLMVLALIISSQNRRLPRMWLLLGLVVAHLAFSIFSVYLSWDYSHWMTFNWTYFSCTLMLSLDDCFDFVAGLCSAMLACHVFMWTFIPIAEKGRRTLVFWIVVEITSWFIGFIVIFALKAPYTEIGFRSTTAFCMTRRPSGNEIEIIESCLKFLLPFAFALPVSCISTCFTIWIKFKTKNENPVALEPLAGASQTNPEYFGVDPMKMEEMSTDKHSNRTEASYRRPLPWVIFSMLIIFFGFALRLPERLLEHRVFQEAVFSNNPRDYSIVLIFSLLKVVYYSFILTVNLVLPEVRSVLSDVYRHCKRICCRG